MKTALIALLLFAYFAGLTQEIQKESANITIRGYVGIPRAVGSKMFSKAFRKIIIEEVFQKMIHCFRYNC